MSTYLVRPSAIRRFAESVRSPGVTPPTFAMAAVLPAMLEVLRVNGFGTSTVVHRAQSLTLHRPIRIGDELASSARLREVRTVRGASTTRVEVDLHDADAAPVCSARATLLVDPPPTDPGPETGPPEPVVRMSLRREDVERYAEASGHPAALAQDLLVLGLALSRLTELASLTGFDAVFPHPVRVVGADPLLVHATGSGLSVHHRGRQAVSVTNLCWSWRSGPLVAARRGAEAG
ncbi:acyl dehydratase [Crossiella equi]|uniref:Acyl dehydratase n=1 Tax=Crossiella equi TaxID=130796 RepID=A0ABS5A731_9PSEU|nr:MaoC family dehydratase N-terminal domain-containing protein [Crossiella equi]MBP2472403.1 acyl dehydratase [Crossiella equi]